MTISESKNTRPTDFLLISLAALLLFVPFLGQVHLFDWDEINFAESAREMIVSGDYLNVRINYELFWEKPPLFIWMQVLSMKIFGINEFAARFPNAVAGLISLLFLYSAGTRSFGRFFGRIWVLIYAGSVLPHFYFKSGLIDPWFNLFIFSGIWVFIRFLQAEERRMRFILFSAVLIGLGTLTKGPVALLMFLLSGFIYLIIKGFRMNIAFRHIAVYIIVYLFVGGFWFILQALSGNTEILIDFIEYQIHLFSKEGAGHGGFPGYHFIVLLIGVFPASLIALKAFKRKTAKDEHEKLYKQWMLILLWTVLGVFSIVNTKIVHYSSLAYFPLTFLAAYAVQKTIEGKLKRNRLVSGAIFFIAGIFALLTAALPVIDAHKQKIIDSGKINDPFALGNLQADAGWTGYEILIPIFLIVGLIFAFIAFRKKYVLKIISVFVTVMLFVNLTTLIITPKIEKYSQNAALEFAEKHSAEDAGFYTFGYKSYAHYFYGKINPEEVVSSEKELKEIKKKIYVLTKVQKSEKFEKKYPSYRKMYSKNGFVFYENIVSE